MTKAAHQPSTKFLFAGGTAVGVGAVVMLIGGAAMLICRTLFADADSMVGLVLIAFMASAAVAAIGGFVTTPGLGIAALGWLRERLSSQSD